MNFLRTQTLMRLADSLKLLLNGETWKTQSNLDLVAGRNMAFDQVESKDLTTLTVTCGSKGVFGYYGSFWDSTNQTVSSTTTAYVVAIGSSDGHDGVTITGGSRITFENKAVMNVATSIQLQNTDTQIQDAVFWFRKNGTDIANSASHVSVPSSHGGVPGDLIFYVDLIQNVEAGDYMEIVWKASSTLVSLKTIAASGSGPAYPSSPSVIVSVVQV